MAAAAMIPAAQARNVRHPTGIAPKFWLMQRTTFVASLIATVAASELLHAAPASAIDEADLGNEVFVDMRDGGEILFDSSYYEHLNEIGAVLTATVKPRYPYPIRYYIVKGDSANAFSVPGGNIYVNEPLLDLAKNKDELAGVLAHETGHMVLHHVAKRIDNANKIGTLAQIASVAATIFAGSLGGMAADYGLENLGAAQDANLSRHIEAQADEEGARIMAATGVYNPWGLVWFFQTMTATYGAGQATWMRDHPLDQQRIDDLEHLFASDPAVFGRYKDTQQRDVAYW
jgi:predicted Zn-dependent protease